MKDLIRLNKYLSSVGACSRRDGDRFIDEGRIFVNGIKAEKGMKVTGDEDITLDGKPVTSGEKKIMLAYYKPRGIVCSTKNQGGEKNNIVDAVNYPIRIYPVGRLDKDSEGLILMTNDGDIVNEILRAKNGHEKEYEVTCDRPISDRDIAEMRKGGLELIEGRISKSCRIRRTGEKSFNCILTEGMNRQIRRMCEWFGYEVVRLKRIRFMNIELDGLKSGEYREIPDYKEKLYGRDKDSK